MLWLKAVPWRLVGIVAAAAAIGLLLWRVGAWREGYLERDQAVADLAAYGDAVAARDAHAAKDREDDGKRREALALALETARAEIEDLSKHPIVSVVYRDKVVNGHSCPDPRVGPDWIRLHNETADVATRAVSRPD